MVYGVVEIVFSLFFSASFVGLEKIIGTCEYWIQGRGD